MKFKLLPTFLVCLLSFLCLSKAQETSGPNVSLKIDFVSWGDDLPPLTVKSGTKQIPIKALPFTYSVPVNYSGSNLLELYGVNEMPNPTKPGNEIPPELAAIRKTKPGLVGIAKLPSASARVTVLIAPGAGGTYQTYVIDDDPTKLPFGNLRIHNYSSELVAFICNSKNPEQLKAGQTLIVPPVEGMIVYEMAYMNEKRWKIQENNVLRISPVEQVQMVVLKSDNKYFVSGDGLRSGHLQLVVLRRPQAEPKAAVEESPQQPPAQ